MINTSLALQIYFDTGDLGARNDPFRLVITINLYIEASLYVMAAKVKQHMFTK